MLAWTFPGSTDINTQGPRDDKDNMKKQYPLVMTNSLPWFFAMALIEIDGLPSYKMGGSFHGELLVITR